MDVKYGNRKTFMLHKLYAEAFYMSENEACRRLYKGFIGYGQAVQNVKDILLKNLSDLEKEQSIGENRHDEILYIQQFLDELKNDKEFRKNTNAASSSKYRINRKIEIAHKILFG